MAVYNQILITNKWINKTRFILKAWRGKKIFKRNFPGIMNNFPINPMIAITTGNSRLRRASRCWIDRCCLIIQASSVCYDESKVSSTLFFNFYDISRSYVRMCHKDIILRKEYVGFFLFFLVSRIIHIPSKIESSYFYQYCQFSSYLHSFTLTWFPLIGYFI